MFLSKKLPSLLLSRAFSQKKLILFGTGKDRTGILTDVSGLIRQVEGNIEESTMSRIGGNFCMMIQVSLPDDLEEDFQELIQQKQQSLGLKLYFNETYPDVDTHGVQTYEAKLHISGADHPGIVSKFTKQLGLYGVNFKNAKSYTYAGPWGGSTMFDLKADVLLPVDVDLDKIREDFTSKADEYNADFTIERVG